MRWMLALVASLAACGGPTEPAFRVSVESSVEATDVFDAGPTDRWSCAVRLTASATGQGGPAVLGHIAGRQQSPSVATFTLDGDDFWGAGLLHDGSSLTGGVTLFAHGPGRIDLELDVWWTVDMDVFTETLPVSCEWPPDAPI
mgnify:CR=1 FL=1